MTLLPKTINTPSENISNYVGFIGGEKKVGKTAFLSQFPDHLIVEFETGNAKHLKCRFVDIPDLKTVAGVLKELKSNPNYCKTLVLDEINILYNMIMEDICKREGVHDLGEIGWARGWGEAERRLDNYFRQFQSLGCGVIYTGHTEVKTVTDRKKNEISTLEFSLKKAVNRMLERYTHWRGTMMFEEEGSRVLYMVGDSYIRAGHGFDNHFQNLPGGKIDLGNSAAEGFRNFMKAWNNQPLNAPVTNKKPSLKDQLNAKRKSVHQS